MALDFIWDCLHRTLNPFLLMEIRSIPGGQKMWPATAGEQPYHAEAENSQRRWLGDIGECRQGQSIGRGEGVQSRNVAGRGGAADALVEVRRQVEEISTVD
jgi:hypothetical protein